MNDPGKIRNIALVGHRGTGKTSLFEALLFHAGAVNRLGKVDDGTTVSDWDDDEKRRQLSLSAGLAHVERGGLTFNLIDTPGDSSFLADTIAALRVVETAAHGRQHRARRRGPDRAALGRAPTTRGLGAHLFCNMLDRERADFDHAVGAPAGGLRPAGRGRAAAHRQRARRSAASSTCSRMKALHATRAARPTEGDIPADLADAAAEARDKLIEAVAETDDELAREVLRRKRRSRAAELNAAFAAAVAAAKLFPVACRLGDGQLVGVDRLLDLLALAPSPAAVAPPQALDGDGAEVELACDPAKPAVAFVFKTLADPFSGRINVFRVFQGTVESDASVVVARDGHKERLGQLLKTQGKENKPVDELVRRRHRRRGQAQGRRHRRHAVRRRRRASRFPAIDFPAPLMSFAVERQEQGRRGQGHHRPAPPRRRGPDDGGAPRRRRPAR